MYLRCRVVGQIEILDLGDALHIFQHLGHKALVGVELPLGKGLLRPLHGGVDGEEQQQSASVISPIRQSKRNIIAAMMPEVRNPLVVTITTRVATFAIFSMVLVVTEVTSPKLLSLNQPIGRVPQMLRNLNPLVGAGAVACTGLEHGGLHVDGDGHDQRNHDDAEARPERRHGDILLQQCLNDNGQWQGSAWQSKWR